MPTPTNPYSARSQTFVAGAQVASAVLNAIQDGIIAVGVEMAARIIERVEGYTATGNKTDSPAPDSTGACTTWIEKSTNGTNEVVLDTYLDWRDRMVVFTGYCNTSSDYIPGGAQDDDIQHKYLADGAAAASASAVHYFAYTRDGGTGPAVSWEPAVGGWGTEVVLIYARSGDGALCLKKVSHAADPDIFVVGEVRCSPVQNHY